MTRRGVAQETLTILGAGGYKAPGGGWIALEDAQAQAVAGTRIYTPDELGALSAAECAPRFEVRLTLELEDATTQVATRRVATPGTHVALLNFASAKNPGGGFLTEARAQEEDLCRCSGLYPCLSGSSARPYYTHNRKRKTHLYSDFMLFSPRVPFFRSCSRAREPGYLLDAAFLADVITAPAPNAGAARREKRAGPALREALTRRAGYVLALASEAGAEVLVLGAWGCGVFRNDPSLVAEAFAGWLGGDYARSFRRVVFAIPRAAGKRNFDAFERRLADSPLPLTRVS